MTLHVDRLGAGPDLVLLHGWAPARGAWSAVAERLAARFRLHVVDLPGHGHSPSLPFTDLDSARRARRPRRARRQRRVRLVARRAGGDAARGRGHARQPPRWASSHRRPSFVTRDGWTTGIAPPVLEVFQRDLRQDRAATVRAFLQLNARGATGARNCVRQLEALLATRPAADGDALAAGLDVLATADLRAASAALSQPAIVIHGLRDELVPADAGRFLAVAMPNARFVGIRRGGARPAPHPRRRARPGPGFARWMIPRARGGRYPCIACRSGR